MAKIQEEFIVLKVSRLLKATSNPDSIITDKLLKGIEDLITDMFMDQEYIDNVIVEVEKP